MKIFSNEFFFCLAFFIGYFILIKKVVFNGQVDWKHNRFIKLLVFFLLIFPEFITFLYFLVLPFEKYLSETFFGFVFVGWIFFILPIIISVALLYVAIILVRIRSLDDFDKRSVLFVFLIGTPAVIMATIFVLISQFRVV